MATGYYTGNVAGTSQCSDSYGCTPTYRSCHYTIRCTTQAEADSVANSFNATTDTTLFACSDSWSGNGALYRLSCKAQGGEVVECNGKTSVNIWEDGTKIRDLTGTCAQNGYEAGIIGGASADSTDSIPPSANADCFATFNGDCYMRDRASGNTFVCACDGQCNIALNNLAAGNAACTNPYPQPTSSGDSLTFPLSSQYEPPPISSASPESSPSFEDELDATNALYGVLDTIRDTINRAIAPTLRNIQANTQGANEYLQQIAGKEWSVNVNVEAPDVHVTNNTDVSGIQSRQDRQYDTDTAFYSRVLDKLGALGDTTGAGNPNDTAGSGAALSDMLGRIDSAVTAYDVPDMSDSIPPTLEGIKTQVRGYRDSVQNGVIGDSVNAWSNAFLNNGVLAGGGSNSCPAVLTRQVVFTFPHVGQIQAGTLGKYLCEPIAGTGITLWRVARMLLRALVAIGCMWWLFKEVTGTTSGGGNDED